MGLLEIFAIAILQGLTEFLPVSSSAHLILVPLLTGWKDQGLAFDVAVHVGSLIAVVAYFRDEIRRMILPRLQSLREPRAASPDARLAWAVIWGSVPVGLAGFALKDLIETVLRTPEVGAIVMAIALIGFGLLLGWSDWRRRGERSEYDIDWRDVLFIGCMQALALIPGTSRSGITITAALMRGFSREAAARFSFLLSIPVIVLAGLLLTRDLVRMPEAVDWTAMLIGVAVSAITAYLCIHYFLVFIRRIGMQPFVIYRILLGLVLLWVFVPRI